MKVSIIISKMLPSDTKGCGCMRMLAERALYDWLVCVCVCMCVCVYVCACVRMCVCKCVRVHTVSFLSKKPDSHGIDTLMMRAGCVCVLCVCVFVCECVFVCVRETEREKERESERE